MRLLITEGQRNKIYRAIYNLIDETFGDDITQEPIMHENEFIEELYFTNNFHLRIFKDKYFEGRGYEKSLWKDISPSVWVFSDGSDMLNSLMGDKWHSVFIDWVENNIPQLSNIKIKSVNRNRT